MAKNWFVKILDTMVKHNSCPASHTADLGKSLNPDQTNAYVTQECCEADWFAEAL